MFFSSIGIHSPQCQSSIVFCKVTRNSYQSYRILVGTVQKQVEKNERCESGVYLIILR